MAMVRDKPRLNVIPADRIREPTDDRPPSACGGEKLLPQQQAAGRRGVVVPMYTRVGSDGLLNMGGSSTTATTYPDSDDAETSATPR
jgi:hypothetical protein